MKPEFKIEGREASPAEYAELMHALLASQAATPTARACAVTEQARVSMLDALLSIETVVPNPARQSDENDGERGVYRHVSGFLEAGQSTSSPPVAPIEAVPGRYE